MLKAFSALWAFSFLLSASIASAAFVLPEKPTARVNDYAGVLSREAKASLEAKFADFEQRSSNQAVVAIFQTIEDENVEDLGNKLFEKWKLGSKEKNNGILLLVSMQERALRIEVGYGLEGQLTDALSSQIIRKDMVPFLKEGQVATAVLVFEKRLEELFIDKTLKPVKKQRASLFSGSSIFWVLFLVFFLPAILKNLTGLNRGRSIGSRGTRWIGGGFGGFGGFGGGGGGFGGGGGGMSGGGGASGRW